MERFETIRETALARLGGEAALNERLPHARSAQALAAEPDDRYLSQMSFRVFSAGLRQSMVEAKWPAFEEVFLGFAPERVRAMSDEALEALLNETRIIRHWGKIKATRTNAAAMCEVIAEHGSFGRWLADWPGDDVVGLWHALQKRFTQLGGRSGAVFLRMVGKDTFMLTPDVIKALNRWGGFDGEPKGKRAQLAVQQAFNAWAAECGLERGQISRILAASVD